MKTTAMVKVGSLEILCNILLPRIQIPGSELHLEEFCKIEHCDDGFQIGLIADDEAGEAVICSFVQKHLLWRSKTSAGHCKKQHTRAAAPPGRQEILFELLLERLVLVLYVYSRNVHFCRQLIRLRQTIIEHLL